MDNFNKYALAACAVMCIIIIGFYYTGLALGLSGLGGGADDTVNNAATASGGGAGHESYGELTQNEEYFGFGMVGVIGGFFVGYLYSMVFESPAYMPAETSQLEAEARRVN